MCKFNKIRRKTITEYKEEYPTASINCKDVSDLLFTQMCCYFTGKNKIHKLIKQTL